MIEKKELATLLGSMGLGVLASFGVEAYGDKVDGMTIEKLGAVKKPSSWLDILAGAIAGGAGYAGYVGKGPATGDMAQNALMGLGSGLVLGGALATVRPKVVPISDEAKALVKIATMDALENAGVTIPEEAKKEVTTLAPAVALATPLTAEEARFAEIYGY